MRNNVITGNLWGITAIYFHDIDMGTEDDWGHNEIHDNGNSGMIYDLYNNSGCDLMAVGNDWGSTDPERIEDHIFHQHDDSTLGLVTFIPYIGGNVELDEVVIDPQQIDPTTMTLFSITGQRVNTSSLMPGVYIAVMKQGSQTIAKKIIIQ